MPLIFLWLTELHLICFVHAAFTFYTLQILFVFTSPSLLLDELYTALFLLLQNVLEASNLMFSPFKRLLFCAFTSVITCL